MFLTFNLLCQNSYSDIDVDAKYMIIQDHHSGKILYEKDADTSIYPASMTKIMTAIVAFDLLKRGETSLDELITISEKAWRLSQSGYSSMFIMLNDQVSVEDLLKGIIIVSGNDACVALAEGLSGSEEDFVLLMNEKSIDMGTLVKDSLVQNKKTTKKDDFDYSLSYPSKEARENFEKIYLLSQLRKYKGNISKTAEFVGMERSALHRKLKSLGIKGIN